MVKQQQMTGSQLIGRAIFQKMKGKGMDRSQLQKLLVKQGGLSEAAAQSRVTRVFRGDNLSEPSLNLFFKILEVKGVFLN